MLSRSRLFPELELAAALCFHFCTPQATFVIAALAAVFSGKSLVRTIQYMYSYSARFLRAVSAERNVNW